MNRARVTLRRLIEACGEVREHAERLSKAPTPHNAEWLIKLCRGLRREMGGCAFGRVVETFGPIADAAARFNRPRVDWVAHKAALGEALAAMEGALADCRDATGAG
jgi:hypothetical protein